ncbi:MAG TPA: TetR family transcriptional regulator [Polyangiaceae bacterium]
MKRKSTTVYKTKKTTPRPRDAEATQAAILASARRAFAAHGYDGAGVREIAAGAGVTAMLVNRYFGSKEKLFAKASAATMAEPIILADANLRGPERAARMAKALVAITTPGESPLEGFQMMLRSAASPTAAKIGRAEIDKRYQKLLAESLKGPRAAERAALVFALVAGVQFMRQSMELTALAEASPAHLVALLTPLFEELIGEGS